MRRAGNRLFGFQPHSVSVPVMVCERPFALRYGESTSLSRSAAFITARCSISVLKNPGSITTTFTSKRGDLDPQHV